MTDGQLASSLRGQTEAYTRRHDRGAAYILSARSNRNRHSERGRGMSCIWAAKFEHLKASRRKRAMRPFRNKVSTKGYDREIHVCPACQNTESRGACWAGENLPLQAVMVTDACVRRIASDFGSSNPRRTIDHQICVGNHRIKVPVLVLSTGGPFS